MRKINQGVYRSFLLSRSQRLAHRDCPLTCPGVLNTRARLLRAFSNVIEDDFNQSDRFRNVRDDQVVSDRIEVGTRTIGM